MASPIKIQSSSLLIQWANEEAGWIRQIVTDILSSKNRATDHDVDRYFDLFLKEKHLGSENAPLVPLLAQTALNGDKSEALALKTLKIKAGVNALKDGQILEFGSSLTVVFGENGSGKSGYVRVLKRAAGVRTAEQILGNVRQTTSSSPRADFEFTLNGHVQPVLAWMNEERIAPLTQIAVFDARSAGTHVDDELTYVYTPGELALFPLVQDAVDRVRVKLNDEITRTSDPRNPFLLHFKRGTSVYPLIEKLGAATDLVHLKALATLSDTETEQMVQLETEVDSLKSTDLRAQLKVAEDQLTLVRDIVGGLQSIFTFDSTSYKKAIQDLKFAAAKELQVTSEAFADSKIPGVLADPWRRFIEAGEQYLKATGQDQDYPKDDTACIYCRQPLVGPALELVRSYREYSSGEARRLLRQAELHLTTCCAATTSLNIDQLVNSLNVEIERGRGASIKFLVEPLKTMTAFKKAVDGRTSELPDVTQLEAALKTANAIVSKLDETITGLGSKSAEREKLLATRQADLAELQARTLLAELWTGIEKKVQDAKWADGASQISKSFTGILRSLTEQAKTATQALLNTNFEALFVEEAKALRAPTVVLQFPGAKGQTLRRKVVGDHRPSEVLSEGEQKVVALADFLAETRVRQPNGPVIFDDPVNSLDFRRAKEVTSRICHLAKTHQVVVFTHSVMFASMLLENADRKTTNYIDIKNDGVPGIASIGTHPRTDTVSDLTKRLDAKIVAAKAATGEVQESLIESGYGILRALTEVLTERGLLRAITARYRANVRVDGLEKLNIADMGEAIKVTVATYSKVCRYIEAHSQPLDHLGIKPTVTELEADYNALKEVLKKYPPVE